MFAAPNSKPKSSSTSIKQNTTSELDPNIKSRVRPQTTNATRRQVSTTPMRPGISQNRRPETTENDKKPLNATGSEEVRKRPQTSLVRRAPLSSVNSQGGLTGNSLRRHSSVVKKADGEEALATTRRATPSRRSGTPSTEMRRTLTGAAKRNNFMSDEEGLNSTTGSRRRGSATPSSAAATTRSTTSTTTAVRRPSSTVRRRTSESATSADDTKNTRRARSRPTSAQQSDKTDQTEQTRKRKNPTRESSVDKESTIPIQDTTMFDKNVAITTHDPDAEEPNEQAQSADENQDNTSTEDVFRTHYDPQNPTKITARLISERCLTDEELETLSRDEITERVLQLERIDLENCNIFELENLEVYSTCTHLYLQHNHIKEISDQFIFMPDLLFLALYDNKIERVENLRDLSKLQFLDISLNEIIRLDMEELPPNVQFLNVRNNPFCADEESYEFYRERLVKALPKLVLLDKIVVTREERERLNASVDESLYAEGGLVDKLMLQMPTQELRKFENTSWKKSEHYTQTEQKLNEVRFERPTVEDTKTLQEARNKRLYASLHKEQQSLREESKNRLLNMFAEAEGKLESRRTKFQRQMEEQMAKIEELKEKFKKDLEDQQNEKSKEDTS